MIPTRREPVAAFDFVDAGSTYHYGMDRDLVTDDEGRVYRSTAYQVVLTDLADTDGWTWLSIKKLDKARVRTWRELQRIKTALVGPHREAVELFPSEDRHVDTANQYHLWCLPPGHFFPFGFHGRLVAYTEDDLAQVKAGLREQGFSAKAVATLDLARQAFDPDAVDRDALLGIIGLLRQHGVSEDTVAAVSAEAAALLEARP